METRNPTYASTASEDSGRRALWYDTFAITQERSLSSALNVGGALLSTGLSVGMCVLKVRMARFKKKYIYINLNGCMIFCRDAIKPNIE